MKSYWINSSYWREKKWIYKKDYYLFNNQWKDENTHFCQIENQSIYSILSFVLSAFSASRNFCEIRSNLKCCRFTLLPSQSMNDLYFSGSQRFISSARKNLQTRNWAVLEFICLFSFNHSMTYRCLLREIHLFRVPMSFVWHPFGWHADSIDSSISIV